MNAFELKTKDFVGPIEKLLELIEEKELDITTVSLSAVTGDFLAYLNTLAEVSPATLADFIVVASRLLVIKSKALLPSLELTKEEAEDIHDLEERLRLYKEFKAAGKLLDKLWQGKHSSYARELFTTYGISVFYPSANLTADNMALSLQGMLKSLEMFQAKDAASLKRAIMTIEQKMSELTKYFQTKSGSRFSELAGKKEKDEVVVLFLALLHLVKDRIIHIEQPSTFSDIIIKSGSGMKPDESNGQ